MESFCIGTLKQIEYFLSKIFALAIACVNCDYGLNCDVHFANVFC